jgi:archaellum biogenesis ATPase FlaH
VDEVLLLSALLDSRDAYATVQGRIALSDFSDLLRATLSGAYPNAKQSAAVQEFMDDIPSSTSPGNAASLYLRVRQRRQSLDVADLILKGADRAKVDAAIAKYQRLEASSSGNEFKERLTYEDLYEKGNDQGKLAVYPARLNEVLRGGVRRGHNIIIFGRPGAAKTLVTVNMVSGMANAGHRVLYIANEENTPEIQRRFLSRLGGVSLWDLNQEDIEKEKRAYREAEQRALKRGYQNVIVTDEFATLKDLEGAVERLKPDVLVLDQIRHVNQHMDLLSRQEAVTRWLRDTAHAHNLIAIGTAQAGLSAQNKPVIGLTDTDFSNTGIQGACDLMIGIGVTEEMERSHKRMLCICRNKISGTQKNFPVWIEELHTKVKSKP